MEPCSFSENNVVYDRPSSMTDEECGSLSAFAGADANGLPVIISCWKLTQDELEEFQRTGRIWLWIISRQMVPVALSAKSPFASGG